MSSLSSIQIPKSIQEAFDHPIWQQAMIDEMQALEHNGTWDLVSLPPRKTIVGCRWEYAINHRLKAKLVAKGYTQVYGLNYGDTFSTVANISSICLFLTMVAIRH
ncbi:putative mitochondrial protein, partial [Mucuna pruriens]